MTGPSVPVLSYVDLSEVYQAIDSVKSGLSAQFAELDALSRTAGIGISEIRDAQTSLSKAVYDALGAVDAQIALQGALILPPKRSATVVVAASTMPKSVKDGADLVCNYSGDDAQLNLAISQASSVDGGVVEVSPGEFALENTVNISSNSVRFFGSGVGSKINASQGAIGTRLMAPIGATWPVLSVEDKTALKPLYGVILRDFSTVGGGDGILFRSNQGIMDNVRAYSAVESGIRLKGYPGFNTYDTRLSNCLTSFNKIGVLFDDNSGDCHTRDLISCKNVYGIWVQAGSEHMQGGQLYDNTKNNILFNGGGQSHVGSMYIENAGENGINFYAETQGVSFVRITDCGFRFNSKSAPGAFSDIGGTGTRAVDNILVASCLFNWSAGIPSAGKAKYGVDIWGQNCKYWKVEGNLFAQPTSAHFTAAPTRNLGQLCTVQAF